MFLNHLFLVVLSDLPLLLPVVTVETLACSPVFCKLFPTSVAVACSLLRPQGLPELNAPDLFKLADMDHLMHQQIEIAPRMMA